MDRPQGRAAITSSPTARSHLRCGRTRRACRSCSTARRSNSKWCAQTRKVWLRQRWPMRPSRPSIGGMLVPRIGLADSGLAGLVVFAGATRPFEDEFVRQYEYLYGLDGQITPKEQAEIDDYKRQAARIKQLTPADANSKERLLFAAPSYWLDLRGYFPPAVAL